MNILQLRSLDAFKNSDYIYQSYLMELIPEINELKENWKVYNKKITDFNWRRSKRHQYIKISENINYDVLTKLTRLLNKISEYIDYTCCVVFSFNTINEVLYLKITTAVFINEINEEDYKNMDESLFNHLFGNTKIEPILKH